MYNAVCYNGVDGLSWIATTQFVIVFFAFIMLTLRVAFYEVEDEKEVKAARRQCAVCWSRLCSCRRDGVDRDVASNQGRNEEDGLAAGAAPNDLELAEKSN
jgi:hypothetical protein